jgi:hypothetical protein
MTTSITGFTAAPTQPTAPRRAQFGAVQQSEFELWICTAATATEDVMTLS